MSFVRGYSTYLGGDCDDEALGVAMDSSGAMYVIGRTESFTRDSPTATGFPVSVGAYDTNFGDNNPLYFHCGTVTPTANPSPTPHGGDYTYPCDDGFVTKPTTPAP